MLLALNPYPKKQIRGLFYGVRYTNSNSLQLKDEGHKRTDSTSSFNI